MNFITREKNVNLFQKNKFYIKADIKREFLFRDNLKNNINLKEVLF